MYKSIAEIKAKNKEAGGYWFTPKTMKFFASRIESHVIKGEYFITSEKTGFNSENRAYTIRKANSNGSIETIGKFNGFATKAEAKQNISIRL